MPFIEVKLVRRWPEETLEKLAAALTKQTQDILDLPAEKIAVVITEVDAKHWIRGGVTIEKITKG